MSDNKINLPKTNFSMKANLAGKEPMRQKEWEKNGLYGKMLDKNKNNQKYILHDGPPYANGNTHLGHALNKVLKDIILKYESMQGKYAPYVPGWDCHGLPIEFQLLKEMNVEKHDIDQLKFRKKAAAYATKYVKIQRDEFKRLGIFGDWENPYLTLTPEYEGSIIKIFKELALKGYIYRGMKPVYWCATCETALAEAEVEYAEHKSSSVYVKFPVVEAKVLESDISLIIWTTTPWTLPSNVAVAFHDEYEYSIFVSKEASNKNIHKNEKFIVATDLLEKVSEKIGIKKYEVIETIKGKELEGIKCESPFREEKAVGVLADYVTTEDGTGIVHIAPGHGEEDHVIGLKYSLPVIAPIDNKGRFTKEVKEYEGQFIFEANPLIIKDLDAKKILLQDEEIKHSYPHCWRCKKPIVFRATNQWFLNIDHNDLRDKIKKSCKDVKWIPKYGLNRITSMVENRPDWCMSRQRLWGTPVPAFYCKACQKLLLTEESMTKVEKLFAKEGSDTWFYKTASQILGPKIKCECGGTEFEKEIDILDVWFDSGVSHEAVLKKREELSWPADLYLEGSDQHRGWFQTSIIPSVALYGKPPYKDVLTHGFTVDGEGKKMSKSRGNVISPHEIINKYGADVLRLWIASENYKDDMRISEEIISQMVDAYRKIRNTARYLLGNLNGFDIQKDEVKYENLLEIDKWALLRLSEVTKDIIKAYNMREFHQVYRIFYNFCTIELSSLYFDILKDRLYVYAEKSEARRSAQTVLYYMISFLTRLITPILPFTAEEIWGYIPNMKQEESIMLEGLPGKNEEKKFLDLWSMDTSLGAKWTEIFEFRKILLKEIEDKRLKNLFGNSLEARVTITLDKEAPDLELTKENFEFWQMIAIVSQVEIIIGDCDKENLVDQLVLPQSLKDTKCSIKVEKARGAKCARCWNWTEDIGKSAEYPEFCCRCIGMLRVIDS